MEHLTHSDTVHCRLFFHVILAVSRPCERCTRRLHHVFLLAVAVAADVVEGEEEVVPFVQLSRQLQLDLRRRPQTQREGRCEEGLIGSAECGATPWRTPPPLPPQKNWRLASWLDEKVGGVIARSSIYSLLG